MVVPQVQQTTSFGVVSTTVCFWIILILSSHIDVADVGSGLLVWLPVPASPQKSITVLVQVPYQEPVLFKCRIETRVLWCYKQLYWSGSDFTGDPLVLSLLKQMYSKYSGKMRPRRSDELAGTWCFCWTFFIQCVLKNAFCWWLAMKDVESFDWCRCQRVGSQHGKYGFSYIFWVQNTSALQSTKP